MRTSTLAKFFLFLLIFSSTVHAQTPPLDGEVLDDIDKLQPDINIELNAVWTKNSGDNPPSFTNAFQWWVDLDTPNPAKLMIRNEADNAWIEMGTLGSAFRLVPGSVGSTEIDDDSLTAADLAPNSVGSSELADNSVGQSELAAGSVGATELQTGSVTLGKIAAGGVDTASMVSGAVSRVYYCSDNEEDSLLDGRNYPLIAPLPSEGIVGWEDVIFGNDDCLNNDNGITVTVRNSNTRVLILANIIWSKTVGAGTLASATCAFQLTINDNSIATSAGIRTLTGTPSQGDTGLYEASLMHVQEISATSTFRVQWSNWRTLGAGSGDEDGDCHIGDFSPTPGAGPYSYRQLIVMELSK